MSRFLFGLGGKWIILPSLVFKTALFTVIILIKSAPSTATQSKIACVFSEGSEKLPSGMVVAKKDKKDKKSKNQKIKKKSKKFKKNQKNYKKTWRANIRVFACEPGSVLGYLITLLCTALIGRPMPGRKASTPTICALVVQVRKLPEEKKREKKRKQISME